MAENKTKPTSKSVAKFLDNVSDDKKRKDSKTVLKLMRKLTKILFWQRSQWNN
ncbi:MAG: hypothetical protein IIB00_06935 [candidate division Zixibacteria bacterium]|nr:hypothetical protein [candidate division Zixibacteria bacterium]